MTKFQVAVAPDGNGDLYAALRTPLLPTSKSWTVLSDLDSRRVLYMHAHCADNCLVRAADLVLVGYGISKLTAPPRQCPVVLKAYSTDVVARRGASRVWPLILRST